MHILYSVCIIHRTSLQTKHFFQLIYKYTYIYIYKFSVFLLYLNERIKFETNEIVTINFMIKQTTSS